MRMMDTFTTSRRTYKDILVFDTAADAYAAGYHMLYHDEQAKATIYGKPIDAGYPKVLTPAVVFDPVEENI